MRNNKCSLFIVTPFRPPAPAGIGGHFIANSFFDGLKRRITLRPKARTKAAHEEDAVSLGNGCVSGALEQRAINPCEAFIACRRRAVPSEARSIGRMKLADGLYA